MLKVSFRSLIGAAGLIVLLLGGSGSSPTPGWTATEEAAASGEDYRAATALLNFLNQAPEAKLRETPGLDSQLVAKVMAHRAAGGKFKNLIELTKVTHITPPALETLLKPYIEADQAREMESARKPVAETPAKSSSARTLKGPAGGASASPGASSNSGPIGAVRGGFYAKLPGFEDLDKIDPIKKTEFLETINHEMCPCGCKGETIGYCLVNDPGCPVIKARAKKIYDDIMAKTP